MSSRLWNYIVTTWRASQEAQMASPARLIGSILVVSVLVAVGFVVGFMAGSVALFVFVPVAMSAFVLVTAAMHRRDLERGRS
jgi:hypothetical protein